MDESAETNILYELLIYSEWSQEPEILVRGANEKNDGRHLIGIPWNWLGPLSPSTCPPPLVQKLVNQQLPWQFAVGGEGRVVAILQEQFLEIRSSRDEYASVLGRTAVPKDPCPQWRKLMWSPDCTMFALGHSNGSVDVYDLIGAHLFTIANAKAQAKAAHQDMGEAVAGMLFCDLRVKNSQWSYELLVVNYKGKINAYFVSSTDGYKKSHCSSVSAYYPKGISAISYHHSSQLLLVSGKLSGLSIPETQNSSFQMGITAWRILLGHPFYKLSLSLEDEMALDKNNWWHVFPLYWRDGASTSQDVVFRMSISPNQNILAAIHTSGALSLWDLPSLRLRKFWDLTLQPNYSDVNPQYCEPGMKRKAAALMSNYMRYHLADVNWWSDDAIILARCCGAVTVSSVYSLKNLLGISPEWFEPHGQISTSYDRGFLVMECESVIRTKKRSSGEVYDDAGSGESSDDEDVSFFTKVADAAKTAMFYVTDSERFRPPRKKMKYLNKTYRLLCLKSTTPEELFTRKINNEEYGEALALAKTYDLDCDLVYQRQWRKTPASVATIQDYLSKITKRSWVLHECLERVPETIDAAKELLLYGLRGTDLQALIAIGTGEDHGRFIVSPPFEEEDLESEFNQYYVSVEEAERRELEMKQKRAGLLKQISFSKLTLEQKQLCECRLKLLTFLDRLATYEAILGGPGSADDFYDHSFFKKFRVQSGLEACIYFAHNSNWQAIAAMFTYHGKETLSHQLTILNNFPETTSPVEYQLLLPKLGYSKEGPVICPWNEDLLRVADWCEIKHHRLIASSTPDDYVVDFYEENRDLLKYREKLSSKILTEWFIERAHEIEKRSSLVDNALDFMKLGMERNIQGLEKLLDDLKVLEVFAYECLLDKDVSLSDIEEMDDYEVVQMLMSQSTEDVFIQHINKWLLPFLERCEKYKAGSKKELLKRYLIDVSKASLKFCRKIFESSRRDQTDLLVHEIEDQMSVALDCIYVCEKPDSLKDVRVILEHLPRLNNRNGSAMARKLQEQVQELEKHLRVAELLQKHGTIVTLGFIQNCSQDSEEIKKVVTKLTRLAGRRFPALSEKEWKILLSDVLEIQKLLCHCVSAQECYEIFLQSLLCTGRQEAIVFAGTMMECGKHQVKRRTLSDEGRISYKLPYQSSVNLIVKASQEYFNSSASASDPCMALAWDCLKLIEDDSPSIEEELDLISSLKLLREFQVNMLPLQVRLCSDRLKFVQQALSNKPKAYRNSQKLLKLAYLLRVCGNDKKERGGKVLSLVAETAFNAKDYESCLIACTQLLEGDHEIGWKVCHDLGNCKEFSDVEARCELLSFAVVHCLPEMLEDILKAKSELQLQVMSDRVKFLMGENFQSHAMELEAEECSSDTVSNESAAREDGIKALWQTGEKTMQVLHSTTKTTKAVLTSVQSSRVWRDAVKWMRPSELLWEDNSSGGEPSNKDNNLQGVCAFYGGLVENSHTSNMESNYQRYVRPDLIQPVEIASKVYRASLLEDYIKSDSQKSCIDAAVVLDLSKTCLPEDMLLSLSLLLSVEQLEDVDAMLKSLPSTPIALQFGSLFFALKIRSWLNVKVESPEHCDCFSADPAEIIRQVEDYMNCDNGVPQKADPQVQKAFKLLLKYNKMLYDFIQAEILHSIGGGVDAVRFAKDDVYKQETILGIAMTMDDSVFQIAMSLAHHYKLPLWDVHMAHLQFLFSDSSIATSAIEARIESLKLQNVLPKQPKLFQEKLESSIYPNIDGKDHLRLLLYFQLLESCGDEPDGSGLRPSLHQKLLKKFKAAVKSLDYKLLMKHGASPLSYLEPILNESNVYVFAKAASKIPDENGRFLEPSTIYCTWVSKYFFEGSGSIQKIPQTTSDWLHRYESCNDMMQRLAPSDVLIFVGNILFSQKALEKLSIECRLELIKRVLKFCKQKSSRMKEDDGETNSRWSSVVDSISKYQQHLQRMEDPLFVELKGSSDLKIVSYMEEFDLSQSVTEKLKKLLTRVVIEGADISLLKTILACCPAAIDWLPSDAYIEAIHAVIEKMRDSDRDPSLYAESDSPLTVLDKILRDVSENRDELMIDDMAVDVLYTFCQDRHVPVVQRLSVLQLLEKTDYLSEEYSHLLLLYQTQVVVSCIWPDYEVSEDDIEEETQRFKLLRKLIASSTTLNHFCSLAELLCHWPQFSDSCYENGEDEAWTTVLCGLASLSEKKALDKMISFCDKAHSKNPLNQQACWNIFQELSKHNSILHILKFAFKTVFDELHHAAISKLRQHETLTVEDFDDELLSLVLERHLTVQVISTSLYKPVIEYLLNQQDEFENQAHFSVNAVIKEIAESGYCAEASSLLLIHTRTHSALSTFSPALCVLQKWMVKPK